LHREQAVDAIIAIWFDTLWQDVTFALRQLMRRPGFAVSVVLLLAMGIGLNAGIFTVINSIVLRPLPLPNPDRLVIVTERTSRFETPTSWPDFLDLRQRNRVLESSAAFTRAADFVFRAGGDARTVKGSSVSAVALLREDFWRAALDADPAIVGKAITVNGQAVDVIGILPSWFHFPADDNVIWMPLMPRGQQADRGWHAFSMVGRLRSNVTLSQAQDNLDSAMQQLAREFPDKNAGRHASVRGFREWSVNGAVHDRLVVLQIAALVLCVMAIANVSSLLLARYSTRRLEFSIRDALGASRARQMRQHMTESLVLTAVGCLTAIGFAWGAVRCLVWLYGSQMPRAAEISPEIGDSSES
jgi:putative ABC transport system permease protein